MGLDILAYFIAGLVVLIVVINILGAIRPAPQRHKPYQNTVTKFITKQPAPVTRISTAQQHPVTLALDVDLCKKYPLIDTAYKNGYRFVSYNPLVMELRD